MPKISIKIKKGKTVDLRSQQLEGPKQPKKKRLFLVIFLLAIIIFLSWGWWFSISQKITFADLIPEEVVVFSLIDQTVLYEQVMPYEQAIINQIREYLNQSSLNFKEDIQPLFKEEIAFILMPSNNQTSLPFVLLLEKKESTAKINQVLGQIEPNLKKDYNFSLQIYRQIEMILLKSLADPARLYAYAQIEDYFIISNSQESLETMINQVINR